MSDDQRVSLQLKDATIDDVEERLAELAEIHRIARIIRRSARGATDIGVNIENRSEAGVTSSLDLTTPEIVAGDARYRMLQGVKQYMTSSPTKIEAVTFGLVISCGDRQLFSGSRTDETADGDEGTASTTS